MSSIDVNAVFKNTIFDPSWDTPILLSDKELAQITKLRSILSSFESHAFLSKLLALNGLGTDAVTPSTNVFEVVKTITRSATAPSQSLANRIATALNSELNDIQTGLQMFDFVEVYTSGHVDHFIKVYQRISKELIHKYMSHIEANVVSLSENVTASLMNNITAIDTGMFDDEVDQTVALDAFVQQATTAAYNYFLRTRPAQPSLYTLGYMVSHLPFLVFVYISNFIKTSDDTSGKPNTFIVHQFAVLALKVYMIQSMLTIYDACDDQHKLAMKPRIMSFMNSIMLEYKNQNFTNYYGKINDLIKQNTMDQDSLTIVSDKIKLSRVNLEKAAMNANTIESHVKSSYVKMYVWLTVLCVSVAAIAGLVFILKKKPSNTEMLLQILYGLCCTIVVAGFISGMIAVVRST